MFVEFPIFIVLLQLFFPKLKLGTVQIPQRYTYMYAQPVHGSIKFNSNTLSAITAPPAPPPATPAPATALPAAAAAEAIVPPPPRKPRQKNAVKTSHNSTGLTYPSPPHSGSTGETEALNRSLQPSEPAFPDQHTKRHAQGPAGDALALPFEQDLAALDPLRCWQTAVGPKQDTVDRTFRNQGVVSRPYPGCTGMSPPLIDASECSASVRLLPSSMAMIVTGIEAISRSSGWKTPAVPTAIRLRSSSPT